MTTAPPPLAGFVRRVRSKARVLGTFVKLAGLEPVDLVLRSGFDFAVVDGEHSQLADDEIARAVRHGAARGLPMVVRLPSVDPGRANRFLEAGAVGIQVSSIVSVAQSRHLRDALRYPPDGTRSVSAAQPAAGYGALPLADYIRAVADDPPLVVGQIETASTKDPLAQIVEPLDVAFVGTTDLSVDLGVPGMVEHPDVVGRIEEIAASATPTATTTSTPTGTSTALGGWAAGPLQMAALEARGATYLVVGSDLDSLKQSLAELEASTRPSKG